jgi:type IV secretory pathway TrbD component
VLAIGALADAVGSGRAIWVMAGLGLAATAATVWLTRRPVQGGDA